MALSPFYNWSEPDNSSLVKNGAQDIRALGDAIDTSVWNVGYGQAGKNKIINGDFSINQRAFTSVTTQGSFGFDRWYLALSGGTATYSAQTFTLGTAPVAGYEGKNFARLAVSTGNDYCKLDQKIESVRTFAGQTVTVSFWAKGTNPATLGSLNVTMIQDFGSGGSPSSTVIQNFGSFTVTGDWARYSVTATVPSISGKTLGTAGNDSLTFGFGQGASVSTDSFTLDLWGVQVEYGSKATPFQTASGGSPQAELAMCQRYYWQSNADGGSAFANLTSFSGVASSSTALQFAINTPVSMRVKPSSVSYSTIRVVDGTNALTTISAVTVSAVATAYQPVLDITLTGATQFRMYAISANNSTSGYIALSAEL
jgi:hypothetical protein